MRPKAEAVAAKYSILLRGSSYLWNGIVKYTNATDRLPDQAGINNVLAEGTWDGWGVGLVQD